MFVASNASAAGQSANRSAVRGRGRGTGRGRGRSAGRGRGRGAGRGRGRGAHARAGRGGRPGSDGNEADDEASFQSYNDDDTPNALPPFSPSRPPGVHFGRPFLRNTMTRAVDFFCLFFTDEMLNSIVTHTNSYAQEKIFSGTHRSYCST